MQGRTGRENSGGQHPEGRNDVRLVLISVTNCSHYWIMVAVSQPSLPRCKLTLPRLL